MSFRAEGVESEAEGRRFYAAILGLRPRIPRYALNDTRLGWSTSFRNDFEGFVLKAEQFRCMRWYFIGWDGTFQGASLTPDAYAWYVKATCGNGAVYVKKENVTL